MKELSIFVDESGDYGPYCHTCPYYVVTFIIHEQKNSINKQTEALNRYLNESKLGIHAVHTAPLIRREKVYSDLDIKERFKIFNTFFHFTRKLNIKYKNIIVDKKHKNIQGINGAISKDLSGFIEENLSYFQEFDKIIVYYDNGQLPLANIITSVFNNWCMNKFEYRLVSPYEYKLFQAADFICTLSLIQHKLSQGQKLNKSEKIFFGSYRQLRINYLKHIKKLEF
ncbi:DUF3800 domain-containing protein [bacterium]|nr:DUF3800 domain-containing protein [bacterium]